MCCSGGRCWAVGSAGSLPTLSHPGRGLLVPVGLPVLRPPSPAAAHLLLCSPLLPHQCWQQANITSPFAFLSILHSEGKLPAFFPVAFRQAPPPLCTSALSLLLFFPTRDVGRVLCFDVEPCPNLAHRGPDETCQVFSCCSFPPVKTRSSSLVLGKRAQ